MAFAFIQDELMAGVVPACTTMVMLKLNRGVGAVTGPRYD